MQWYYAQQGKSIGPVTEDDFQKLVASGNITPQTLVWHEGMPEWVKQSTINQPPPALPNQQSVLQQRFAQPGRQEIPAGGNGSTPNKDLMAQARAALSGNWGIAIGATIISGLVNGVAGSVIPGGSLLIGGAMALGLVTFFLTLIRGQELRFSMIFDGFQRFVSSLGAYFFIAVFTLLWTLLLIIPGIIASLSYSMTFYIMADDPSIGCMDAIDRSKEMMKGMKWKLFCLGWRFFGWALLCILTCFIGFFWLAPYVSCATARFYEDVKGRVAA